MRKKHEKGRSKTRKVEKKRPNITLIIGKKSTRGDDKWQEQERRKRRHLCAAPALLPMLLLQLCVLDSQLEAGQLGHERLVTHMERVRDRELERERRQEESNDGERFRDVKRKEERKKVKRASRREGLVEKRRGGG